MFKQNFKRQRAQERRNASIEDNNPLNESALHYPFRLNFYNYPPLLEITIEQFEQWAIDRMRVLGEIEARLARNMNSKELELSMKPILDELLPLGRSNNTDKLFPTNNNNNNPKSNNTTQDEIIKEFNNNEDDNNDEDIGQVDIKNGKQAKFQFDPENEQHRRLKDHYSHFILRLAFCRSQELRRKFVHAETTLFKIRYNTDDIKERNAFVKTCNLPWEPVSMQEKRALSTKLVYSGYDDDGSTTLLSNPENNNPEDIEYFKINFEKVPFLVEDRRVLLHKGMAYVPITYQRTILTQEFASRLDRALIQTVRALPRLDEDSRLVPLLNHLALGFEAVSTYDPTTNSLSNNSGGEEMTAEMVDQLATTSDFPLCMQTMHQGLLQNKHLRYTGRIQYGLFLKWIGLSVDEALKFWKSHFGAVSEDKFAKEYRYNIRHQYGLEGSRINYKPQSCADIIKAPPPARGEYHGCPYRTLSTDALSQALRKMGISDPKQLTTIQDSVAKKQFHIACTKVFEITHPEEGDGDGKQTNETITYPNQYFEKSWRYRKAQQQKMGSDPSSIPTEVA